MPIQSKNPATGEVLKTFTPHSDAQVDAAIENSLAAHQELRLWSFEKRANAMRKVAEIFKDEAATLGNIATLEMGKTLKAAIGEVKKCASAAEFYAKNAEEIMRDEIVQTQASKAYRCYQPMGPILAVMPWNYPIWQVARFACPALMAGNTTLLKHASNVPQCALYLEDIFTRAGFPKGAFQTLLIGGHKVERVLRNEHVRAATLTGSEPAGASVAAICGELIKPTVLELGGSDAFIIMPSADLEKAVTLGTTARVQNNGQSCIAAKRIFVHADIYDDVKTRFKEKFEALRIGDPMNENTDIGPLVNQEARETVQAQVDTALKDGAKRVTGAHSLDGPGYYFQPGILEDIPKTSAAYHEEIFAPVMLLFKIKTLRDAIEIANSSPFGLGSAIFTNDADEQAQAIRDLQAGATFVNSMTSSDPRLPFGGIKRSGYGRELAREGLLEFCNIKTVSIA